MGSQYNPRPPEHTVNNFIVTLFMRAEENSRLSGSEGNVFWEQGPKLFSITSGIVL